jgi:hypothetical protein
MGRIKAWSMDMEQAFEEGMTKNPETLGEVLEFVHSKMHVVDDKYIRELWHKHQEGDMSRETLNQQKERENNNGRQED